MSLEGHVTLTEAAAKKAKELLAAQLQDTKSSQNPVPDGLRLGVRGGGCAGLQYVLAFSAQDSNDHVFEQHGLKVYIDKKSALYLKNITLDYEESLMGSGFRIHNPNQKMQCGCGKSFA